VTTHQSRTNQSRTHLRRPTSPGRSGSLWRRWPAATLALASAATLAATSAVAATTNLAAGAAPAPASHADAAVNLSQVTLDIGDQAGTGAESLLKAAGLLGKLPFKASWSDFPSGPPMLQAEASGSVDIGGVGDAPPVFAAAGGAKIAVVEALRADPNAAALVVPKGSDITSVSQLKGKTIAVSQGSSADYHLLAVLNKAGISVHQVTLDYLQPAEGLAALISGKVDAWDVWSPFIEEVVHNDGARVLVNGSVIGRSYSFVVASRSALANPGKVAAIRAYLADLNEAYAWEKTHPSAWATTWAAATGLSTGVMQQATKDDVSVPAPITSGVIGFEQSVANAFYSAGLIPNKVDFQDYSYTGFNSYLFESKS
jgi:sulfonate transport system substrate-binding protein